MLIMREWSQGTWVTFMKQTLPCSQVKVVNVEQERQVMEDVIRTLDRHENDNLPQVKLSATEVLCRRYQLKVSCRYFDSFTTPFFFVSLSFRLFSKMSSFLRNRRLPWKLKILVRLVFPSTIYFD